MIIFFFFLQKNNGDYLLSKNHEYYHQMQAQMVFSKCDFGYLCLWTPKDMQLFKIEKEDSWVANIPILLDFYYNQLIPKLKKMHFKWTRFVECYVKFLQQLCFTVLLSTTLVVWKETVWNNNGSGNIWRMRSALCFCDNANIYRQSIVSSYRSKINFAQWKSRSDLDIGFECDFYILFMTLILHSRFHSQEELQLAECKIQK